MLTSARCSLEGCCGGCERAAPGAALTPSICWLVNLPLAGADAAVSLKQPASGEHDPLLLAAGAYSHSLPPSGTRKPLREQGPLSAALAAVAAWAEHCAYGPAESH